MSIVDQAIQTQLKNIQTRTGKSLKELISLVRKGGFSRHGEIRDMLKKNLSLGHGDTNTLAHYFLTSDGTGVAQTVSSGDVLDEIYSGARAHMRPIHEKLMSAIKGFGEFEIAPKKGYVSLRRKKQFAMIGPATNSRVEVGLNVKGLTPSDKLVEMPAGGMCNFIVKLNEPGQVNKELIDWIRKAYDSAG